MGQGNREIRHPRKMRKSNPLNRIAQMSDATSNASNSVERDGSASKRRLCSSPLFVSYMRGVRREAVFIVMRYKNTDLPGDENIQKYRPVGCGTPVHRQIVVISSSLGRWEDCFVSYATKRILDKQSARPARRHEGRHGRREETTRRWAVRKTERPLLSNRPVSYLVDHAGLQPATFELQIRCSRD